MPIYEYLCSDCCEAFETIVSGGREQDVRCPRCESEAVVRKLSVFASRGTDKGGASCSGCKATSCSSCG